MLSMRRGFVVATDRGGHLHGALRLLSQMKISPELFVTTLGPDVNYLPDRPEFAQVTVAHVPQAFSWIGKKRLLNPFLLMWQTVLALRLALKYRPRIVISTGASDVIAFCYLSWILGAKIIHIENMAQVVNPSFTGRALYPICSTLFVQFQDLLGAYGPKARFLGWVL